MQVKRDGLKRKKFFVGGTIILFTVIMTPGAQALKVFPLVDAFLYTGQSYFAGEASGLGIDFSLAVIPVLRINEKIDILPRYSGRYQGNKQLAELLGGGTLFQQAQDHGLSLKYLHALDEETKFKIALSGKVEVLRETVGETIWGKGLYDYNESRLGLEWERELTATPPSLRIGYDFYLTRFPNYKTLASQTEYGSELAGGRVLDYNAHQLSFSAEGLLRQNIIANFTSFYTYAAYVEQKIVDENGQYPGEKRSDNILNLEGGITYVLAEFPLINLENQVYLGLNYGFNYNQSNQNHYDVEKTMPLAHFYDYIQHDFNPSITFKVIPWELDIFISYNIGLRQYLNRPAQDIGGEYGTEKMYLESQYGDLHIAYPLGMGFSLNLSAGIKRSYSNMTYEKIYKYNYCTGNYLAGLTYQY